MMNAALRQRLGQAAKAGPRRGITPCRHEALHRRRSPTDPVGVPHRARTVCMPASSSSAAGDTSSFSPGQGHDAAALPPPPLHGSQHAPAAAVPQPTTLVQRVKDWFTGGAQFKEKVRA
jgi:hypothetical protein